MSPYNIWSGDETEVQNVPREVKGIRDEENSNISTSQWGAGETSMILMFVSAAGQSVPPLFVLISVK